MILIIHLLQPSKSNLQNQAKQSQVEMDGKFICSFQQNVNLNDMYIVYMYHPFTSAQQKQLAKSSKSNSGRNG